MHGKANKTHTFGVTPVKRLMDDLKAKAKSVHERGLILVEFISPTVSHSMVFGCFDFIANVELQRFEMNTQRVVSYEKNVISLPLGDYIVTSERSASHRRNSSDGS